MKPQSKFPLLDRYKEVFPITERTIFPYDREIYTNYPLTPDLLVHEQEHLRQQKEIGLDKWVHFYLSDGEFRLEMELEAYKSQLSSLPRKEKRRVRKECIKTLSSNLYGNIISKEEATHLLNQ